MGKGKEERNEEMEKKKKKKGKGRERERERETAGIAAATATRLTRAPVGRDARDADEQGVGTTMDSDVGTGFSGVREIGQGTILNGLS